MLVQIEKIKKQFIELTGFSEGKKALSEYRRYQIMYKSMIAKMAEQITRFEASSKRARKRISILTKWLSRKFYLFYFFVFCVY